MLQLVQVRTVLGFHHADRLDVGRDVPTVERGGPVTGTNHHRLVDGTQELGDLVLFLDPLQGLRQGLHVLDRLILIDLLVGQLDQTNGLDAQVQHFDAHMEAVSADPTLPPIIKPVSLANGVDVAVVA